MTDERPVASELSRELSLFHITMMGLGMMIGAGVFARATVPFVTEYLLGLEMSGTVQSVIVRGVALSIAGLFIHINYRGSSETGKVGAFFTIAQMLFVVGIGIVGVIVAIHDPQRLQNFQPFLNQPTS